MNKLSSDDIKEIIEWTVDFLNDVYFEAGKFDGRPPNTSNLLKLLNRQLPDGLIINSKNLIEVKKSK